jgi:prepilin-type processing-associated H-X9-DG protein
LLTLGTYTSATGKLELAAPLRESSILAPSEMNAFGDDCVDPKFCTTSDGYFNIYLYKQMLTGGTTATRKESRQRFRNRHNDMLNVGFCDGHLESSKFDLVVSFQAQMLSRWFRDHQPHSELFRY